LCLEVIQTRTLGPQNLKVPDTGVLELTDLCMVETGILKALDLEVIGQIAPAQGTPDLVTLNGVTFLSSQKV
ncbi:hypothetical protein NL476_27090, partial [Klebsiella pneumoniae]|nr:hypothetical protein [Klebsiella pneumoniae]